MESKFPKADAKAESAQKQVKDLMEMLTAAREFKAGKLPDHATKDLVKHAMTRIDQIAHDTLDLIDDDYDRFKVAMGIGYAMHSRLGTLAEEVLGEVYTDMDKLSRMHALADLLFVMTSEDDASFHPRHILLRVLLAVLLSMKHNPKTTATTEALERARQAWKDMGL